jgi:hypothetical protein
MRGSLSWGSVRLALAVSCALAGGLLFASAPALASTGPEAPTTEPCSGPIKAGGGVEVCGTLNPNSSEKLTSAYFTFSPGSTCTGNDRVPVDITAGQEEAIKVSAELTGLEPNTEYAYCLVAENATGKTSSLPAIFHTAPVAPTIQNLSATEITDETATLEAQINPENSETEYEVVIADPCGGPPDCVLSREKIIPPSGHEYVRIELAGKELHLEPNTTYEYWIIAKNSDAQKAEVHETFTTLKTPSIDSESASDITEHDAILEAKINSEGQDVYYQFQIVKSSSEFPPEMACPAEHFAELCLGSPATAGALPIGFLLAGSADSSVGLDLERERGITLQPETTYHYRVIAVRSAMSEDTITWKGPPAYGADQTFTTQGPQSTSLGFLTGSETGSEMGNFAPPPPTVVKPKTPAQVRAGKLAKALRLCKKYHKKSRRTKCDKAARKKYGPPKAKTHGEAKK